MAFAGQNLRRTICVCTFSRCKHTVRLTYGACLNIQDVISFLRQLSDPTTNNGPTGVVSLIANADDFATRSLGHSIAVKAARLAGWNRNLPSDVMARVPLLLDSIFEGSFR